MRTELASLLFQPETSNSTGNGFKSFRIEMKANKVKSTDLKVGRRADVGNILIKI